MKCAFIAGSIVRGEGTVTSDIDLVIVQDKAVLPEYEKAFKEGFSGNIKPVLELADKLLAPFGGRFWASWKQEAPDVVNSYQKKEKN